MQEPLSPWWSKVQDAAQLLASQLNASVGHAARVGEYTSPPGSPPPRRRRRPASLRHLAEVIRSHRLAPGMSIDKDDVAGVLAGDLRRITDPALVVAVARASHVIAGVPFDELAADRLVVASAHVAALIDAAQQADEQAPRAVPAPRPAGAGQPAREPVVIDAYFTTRRPGRLRALVAGGVGAIVLTVVLMLVLRHEQPHERSSAVPPAAPTVVGVTPLEHGHAEDDYLNARPLQDALERGFTSVEADVFLRDGTLVLCHHVDGDDCEDKRDNRVTAESFESVYLHGLRARVNASGGRVYPGYDQPVFLFVEIKCAEVAGGCKLPADMAAAATDPNNPLVVAEKIMSVLAPYRGMLFHAGQWGPVQLVVSGSHNDEQVPASAGGYDSVRGLLGRQAERYAFLDGSFAADGDQYNADLVPVISFADPDTRDDCTYDDSRSIQTVHWDDIIGAQTTGHHVRVWDELDCPDRSRSWTDAIYGSVDYLSSSHLSLLQDWLTHHVVGGGGGHCAVPAWIATVRLRGQNCTLRAGTVPVMSRPDRASSQVGTVAGGGSRWFLGQQPGESNKVGAATNFWWAYTRADNGQWGWVSLVYFTDAGLDQSANGLQYGCYDVRVGEPDNCHPLGPG
ncbi:PI-PLC domain-containing protein [Actinoplanes awajinensis]|uniref:GP-PDE domain-containing protein n=1 Tax=Actinoplanes awajinensis subsp. mycoplanecinus TaxID=135947 RepID=A0A0X3V4K3_9ACTN|nr:hypothetical protein [Actinoplanes awajinensis]KUL39594.1 hypothetical protein ADL15_08995 [Actinoplanes awajinensis subsp. mycoplanecinus]